MTMALFGDGGFDTFYPSEYQTSPPPTSESTARTPGTALPLIEAKLRRPEIPKGVAQERLMDLLDRSVRNHSATLLLGRAGSGKTTLAAGFASGVKACGWYTLDAGDADWGVFSRYFRAAVSGTPEGGDPAECRTPLGLLAGLASSCDDAWPSLLVLDGVHHLFDAEWFNEFFDMLIASLPENCHLLVLSRSKPPGPLWRMRSKQVLNVIDEKLLALSPSETAELFAGHGLSKREAAEAHRECFGRAGKLASILESRRRTAPPA